MEIGQAIPVRASESLGTPATIGWCKQILHEPGHLYYGRGLYIVTVYDQPPYDDDQNECWVDSWGYVYTGPPDRQGRLCYWP